MSTEQRITRLERSNRNLRWCLAGVVLVIAGVTACRQNSVSEAQVPEPKAALLEADAVQTKKLLIVDDEGNVVGQFINSGRHSGLLSVGFGKTGGPSATLSSSPDYNALRFDDGKDALYLTPSELRLSRRTTDEVQHRSRILAMDEASRKTLTPEAILPAYSLPKNADVQIGHGESGGGIVTIKNTLGNDVVSVQANKANAGGIYVNDLNGKFKSAITGD
jgi:hypothetical protein